ncbi:N-acetylglucosamine-6-phosphate deacetylase [Xaviernesmea oryzae]|uniref:N-acetylglucosamine-6-phosphate deacetylase n=1 Tax=Xaviernesmea oryzae TaxID=464029 RepID=A0A1Q9B2J8_9HYPH|nr:N-acetylglucosamine-6-phosphate deacetylase [Xaviernesmea oryzae]OLP62251.1 N-acetylglucosamine-6-phosphate deacetylase [Xaviernesmea oryzae]SEL93298.1 N-acetylglucosamine-6-phosphate deacetylase [Xaviernesmea oryzae]
MSDLYAITGARIFDGQSWHDEGRLLVDRGQILGVVMDEEVPAEATRIDASGQLLVPGFIDLQVNGGGGVLFNDVPDVEAIERICAAHARYGTTALLATLITDGLEVRARAIEAGHQARLAHVPGFLGLHLEGPHLSVVRKGVHDASLIRPMEEPDLDAMLGCAHLVDHLMVTIAPESVTPEQVRRMREAGIVVSLGHTDADYATALSYAEAGATTVTHLFNAMSPLGHRQPGMVGAALSNGQLSASVIADGFHVDAASIGIALRAKMGPGRIFLVTDAMSTIGSELSGFLLNGREIFRKDGRLTLENGTLAGADIDMLSSVLFLYETVGISLEEALRMASSYPADVMGISARKGRLLPGLDADFVLLTADLDMVATYVGGKEVYRA